MHDGVVVVCLKRVGVGIWRPLCRVEDDIVCIPFEDLPTAAARAERDHLAQDIVDDRIPWVWRANGVSACDGEGWQPRAERDNKVLSAFREGKICIREQFIPRIDCP